jgi:(p)ppGpp synthase/HD superfamily hydrolase
MTDKKMTLGQAIRIAEQAHHGQYDWYGKPFICHPIHVMENIHGEELKIIAVLHDVVEDTNYTLEMLIAEGLSEKSAHTLECLTRHENEDYEDYIKRVLSDKWACKIKLCDLEHNMDVSRNDRPLTENGLKRIQKYHRFYLMIKEHLFGSHK